MFDEVWCYEQVAFFQVKDDFRTNMAIHGLARGTRVLAGRNNVSHIDKSEGPWHYLLIITSKGVVSELGRTVRYCLQTNFLQYITDTIKKYEFLIQEICNVPC